MDRENNTQSPDLKITLNSSLFVLDDAERATEKLRDKTDLRVAVGVEPYYSEGGPFPPDVILNILYTLVPLGDLYAGIVSSMLSDAVKAALLRRGSGQSKVTFSMSKVDEEGRVLHAVVGRTSDPEIIKELIRQVSEDESGPTFEELFRQVYGENESDDPNAAEPH